MPLARASELDRLLECPGPAILPRDDLVPGYVKSAPASRGAQWGTLCHRWKETGVLPDNIVWAKPLDRKIKASGIDRIKQWPLEGEHEVAMAYNVVTGKAIRCKVPAGAAVDYKDTWKLAFDDQWIVGTLDFAMELISQPWVDDLKTGRILSVHEYDAQQAFYCMAWSLVTYDKIVDTRSTLTHWPRYPLETPPRRYGGVLDTEHLVQFKKKLGRLRDKLLREREQEVHKLKLVVGEHCRFCPVKGACPKMKEETIL